MADERELLDLIGNRREGILAGVTRQGYPHLTNIRYVWDPGRRIARVSTTADRVKGRIFRRDPHAALHVPGDHFFSYAVAECDAELSDVATRPGDDASRELLEVHSAFYDNLDEDEFYAQMVEARRLVVRLHVRRVYGVLLDRPPGT
jgi:PPOX class probable F420-dependent enzyme